MKLWKIMLAVIVAVLMISCVAMADECPKGGDHTYGSKDPVITYANKGDNQHWEYTSTEYFCACGDTYYVRSERPVDCTWVDNGDHVARTCTTDGYQPKKCSVCGRTGKYTSDADKAPGHNTAAVWYSRDDIAATCQTKAKHVYLCKACGQPAKYEEFGSKANHSYTDKEYSVKTSCTQDGVYVKNCEWCGKNDGMGTYHEPAKDHAWDTYKTIAPTCTEKGYTMKYCPTCGATKNADYTNPKHTWEWKAEVAATCGKDGVKAHGECKYCGVLSKNNADICTAADLVIPKNADAHIMDTSVDPVEHISDCGAHNNYIAKMCKVCNEWYRDYVPAKAHKYPEIKNGKWVSGIKSANCTEAGEGVFACEVCGQEKTFVIPALGHDWGIWHYENVNSCTLDLTAYRNCIASGCDAVDHMTVSEAPGHTWVEIKGTKPTCTEAGKVDRKCAKCGVEEYGKTIAALGHDFSKVVEIVKPTCEAQGYTVYTCSRGCADTKKADYVAALGHSYQWVPVVKPSEAGNGKNEYTCQICKHVADTKTVKYTKYYYNNTMTSFGPTTKELVGGNDWYRVTPVDVTVDGVYTYDLIASNKYVVGTVTISVNAGTLTVSYKVKNNVDVKDESLLIYASKADLAAGSAVTAPVGAAINVAETFGADGKVLVSLILTGDYDAAGKDLVNDAAAAGMIANID